MERSDFWGGFKWTLGAALASGLVLAALTLLWQPKRPEPRTGTGSCGCTTSPSY